MKRRTPDEDLDDVLRSGAGRRFLARLIRDSLQDTTLGRSPEETAYNLGMASVGRTLDGRLRAINAEAWLLMQREMVEEDSEDAETPHDA